MTFATPPPTSPVYELSFPAEGVLLATINRPRQMNSIPFQGHWDFDKLWRWFDKEPSLRTGVITGAGDKSFCAGQDLLEVERNRSKPPTEGYLQGHPPSGFAGISQRRGKKPIIAAVNGFAFGGGFEICLNCDLVIASPRAQFSLPEAKRGIYAAAGGLPRIMRIAGLQVASEIALTGRPISAEQGKAWLFVNRISKTHESLIDEAVKFAQEISDLSPDAVLITRAGIREAWDVADIHAAVSNVQDRFGEKLMTSPNTMEGLAAFREKRKPKWVGSKL